MAGDWIKMRSNLWDDPRIARLVDETNQTEAAVIGGLYWLWSTADQHSSDGTMHGMTLRGIDRKTGVPGLGAALVLVGWIAETTDGVTVSRFDEHNGASAKARAQTGKRVANHKANAKVTQTALPQSSDTVTVALPREEKRREEQSKVKNNDNTVVVAPPAESIPAEPGTPTAAAMPPREDPAPSNDPAIELTVALRKLGVTAIFTHPTVQEWARRNVQMLVLNQAIALAREQKGDAPIPVNYLAPIVDKLLHPPPPRSTERRTALDPKWNPNDQDRSADAELMAAAQRRMGMDKPATDEEIEI